MAWISLIPIALISLWGLSLWRLLCSPSSSSRSAFLSNGSGKRRNVLLVVAHPDDESMFFAPTILFLVSKGHNLHILCMSLGDADGMGNIRKEELYRACAVLKVPLEQIKVLDHPNLQDGFDKKWDHQLLAGHIEDQIKMWDIDSVITFDNFGVSGHPNHRDVHHGICKLLHGNSQRKLEAWELTCEGKRGRRLVLGAGSLRRESKVREGRWYLASSCDSGREGGVAGFMGCS